MLRKTSFGRSGSVRTSTTLTTPDASARSCGGVTSGSGSAESVASGSKPAGTLGDFRQALERNDVFGVELGHPQKRQLRRAVGLGIEVAAAPDDVRRDVVGVLGQARFQEQERPAGVPRLAVGLGQGSEGQSELVLGPAPLEFFDFAGRGHGTSYSEYELPAPAAVPQTSPGGTRFAILEMPSPVR